MFALLLSTILMGQSNPTLYLSPGTKTYYARFVAGDAPDGSMVVAVKDADTGASYPFRSVVVFDRWADRSWRALSVVVANPTGKPRVARLIVFRKRG